MAEPILTGWISPEERTKEQQSAHEKIVASWPRFFIKGMSESTEGKRSVHLEVQKALNGGKYFPLTVQRRGSCVSHGGFNAVRSVMAWDIVKRGDAERFILPYIPYLYGASRKYGTDTYGVNWGRDDGSLGSYLAEAVKRYGVLASDFRDLIQPKVDSDRLDYSAKMDGQWAFPPFIPSDIIKGAVEHPIEDVAELHGYTDVRDALVNGKGITIAWNYDLSDRLTADRGKMWTKRGSVIGGHQVAIIEVDDDPKRPGALIANSWPKGVYPPQTDGPDGSLWIDAELLDNVCKRRDAEVFAFDRLKGFPEERLTLADFDLVG